MVDSINRVDLDLRKNLFSNVVLSGGTTLCKGYFICSWGDAILTSNSRLRGSLIERSKKARTKRYKNQDLCTAGTQVFDVDRRLHPCRLEHIQEGAVHLLAYLGQ